MTVLNVLNPGDPSPVLGLSGWTVLGLFLIVKQLDLNRSCWDLNNYGTVTAPRIPDIAGGSG
ncbi:hypothetical protein ACFPP6_22785 [Streptomyces aureoversilis]|uniref:Uncharacterized protein n=1 Tax=Streptomyces aureoversilis TaxID=67277 RepID=A0ABW0A1J7_9ACTN